MAKGYFIAHQTVTNPEGLKEYVEKAGPVLSKYGAVRLVRGGKFVQLEGQNLGERHIILEFESYEKALEFYNSEDYQAVIGLRHKNAISYVIIIEGV